MRILLSLPELKAYFKLSKERCYFVNVKIIPNVWQIIGYYYSNYTIYISRLSSILIILSSPSMLKVYFKSFRRLAVNYPRVDKVMVRGVKRLFINPNSELLGDLINKLVRSLFDSEYPSRYYCFRSGSFI